jgi:hypothetical protein
MYDILGEIIRRNPLRSQREACQVAARRSIAAFGPAKTNEAILSACLELTEGLFGNAYSGGSTDERERMLSMMDEEYRKAIGR